MSTRDMIEKVARALALADLDPETRSVVNLDAHMLHVRKHYSELARAAIEAMREADNDMLEAMHNAMFADPFDATNLPMLGAGFEAAIDASLKDKP